MSVIQPPSGHDPLLVSIGDIGFSAHWLVTPVGAKPLKGTQILVADFSRTERKTPTWAIVLAVLGIFFFLLGLLFLLVKEDVTTGSVQITVHNDGLAHATNVPVNSYQAVVEIQNRANYVRQLINIAA
jgi:hypothetical protein